MVLGEGDIVSIESKNEVCEVESVERECVCAAGGLLSRTIHQPKLAMKPATKLYDRVINTFLDPFYAEEYHVTKTRVDYLYTPKQRFKHHRETESRRK